MFTGSDIRRQVFKLKDTDIFTTRDCLRYGTRDAVDKSLSRLVKKGIIRRLARGVFARDSFPPVEFSDEQIAGAKAKSFGRSIVPLYKVMPDRANQESVDKVPQVFLIDGRSSKFTINGRTIVLKQICKRRLEIMVNKSGYALSSLWDLGKNRFREQIREATKTFLKPENESVWNHMRWLPSWLGRVFLKLPPSRNSRDFWQLS